MEVGPLDSTVTSLELWGALGHSRNHGSPCPTVNYPVLPASSGIYRSSQIQAMHPKSPETHLIGHRLAIVVRQSRPFQA